GRKGGAAWVTIVVSLVAGIAGTILLPPFGGIIAAPLSILLLEYLRLKDIKKAWRAFTGLTLGWGLSFAARFALGALIFVLWIVWLWKG
ncbi:MAG: putative rane protein, partial [Chloroflexi bacterium]|nr:putative rane protein [Chloroflexota bacterium]